MSQKYPLYISALSFFGGIVLGAIGTVYVQNRKKYITYPQALELAAEIEESTLEQVLETLDLIDNQKTNRHQSNGRGYQ